VIGATVALSAEVTERGVRDAVIASTSEVLLTLAEVVGSQVVVVTSVEATERGVMDAIIASTSEVLLTLAEVVESQVVVTTSVEATSMVTKVVPMTVVVVVKVDKP